MSSWKLGTLLALVAACSGSEPTCCSDNYPVTYALIYGTVHLATQAPAANALVRAGDGMAVRSDSVGRYRLLATLHGVSARTWPVGVTVFRSDLQGRLVDSSSVQTQAPFFDTQPPRDSVRVDILTPWSR